ncbi:helix-turn-helix domain-containing protein [Microbaculum marinum]|uniref:Helix-turn-helix domain-containing protein n=1 Tax=Microbaculum marinum TaxID=1764581 RepID=A0AAW9RKQ5_9HYPH
MNAAGSGSAGVSAGQWSTRNLPDAVRAEAARHMLSQVHLPWSLKLRDRAAYQCRLDWRELGGCTLIDCRSAPLAGWRGTPEIRRTQGDHLGLLLVLSGTERVRQGETAATLGSGDMLLWDAARPLAFEVAGPLHKITVLIPRERLARACSGDRFEGTRPLNGHAGLGALVAGHVTALGRFAHEIPAGDVPLASDLIVDLLGRLLAPTEMPAAAGDLMSRVLRIVEARLEDPDLSPTTIAAAVGVTPRYLHMAFADSGRTLSTHIRLRRTERMRRDLTDPRMAHLSITDIAMRWGFADSAHASRTFRKAYGMSPSAFRAGSR